MASNILLCINMLQECNNECLICYNLTFNKSFNLAGIDNTRFFIDSDPILSTPPNYMLILSLNVVQAIMNSLNSWLKHLHSAITKLRMNLSTEDLKWAWLKRFQVNIPISNN